MCFIAAMIIVDSFNDLSNTYSVRLGVIYVRKVRFHPNGRLDMLVAKMALG